MLSCVSIKTLKRFYLYCLCLKRNTIQSKIVIRSTNNVNKSCIPNTFSILLAYKFVPNVMSRTYYYKVDGLKHTQCAYSKYTTTCNYVCKLLLPE